MNWVPLSSLMNQALFCCMRSPILPWSDGLEPNSQAYQIAASDNPRVRVLAGPGTGKSFAMKRRVARLLESDVPPGEILPVTFTRVAAEDLHRELVTMQVPGCVELKGRTLHSLALSILMRNHVLQVTGRTARPLNEFELEPLIFDLLDDFGGKKRVAKKILAFEAAWARLQYDDPGYPEDPVDAAFSNALISWLRFHNAMLIGEVIPQLYEYLRSNPAAPERVEFTQILVDEFQDLNRAEQGVIEMLSDGAEVCIVGDDDQSIYSFKHAHPEGILDWLDANWGADDFTLDLCRRCPTRVVEIANSLIAHNLTRPTPRVLYGSNGNGLGDIRIIQFGEIDDEILGIANLIADLIDGGVEPGEILVLAQRGAIGTPIFDALNERNIPVKSYYAEAELDNVVAQRNFALLKLLVNRDDRVALRWLVGQPSQTWFKGGFARVRDYCSQHGRSPWEVLQDLLDGNIQLSYTGPLVSSFEDVLEEIETLDNCEFIEDLINLIFPEDETEVSRLRSLALSLIDELEIDNERDLLTELSNVISLPEIPSEVEEVRIMSLHKSKGLSAPVTIIPGCVEGLLPKQPSADLSEDQILEEIEEQRRLFFVGITRTKAEPENEKPGTLILTYSREMPLATALGAGIQPANYAYGTATLHASRFIQELGPAAPQPIQG